MICRRAGGGGVSLVQSNSAVSSHYSLALKR